MLNESLVIAQNEIIFPNGWKPLPNFLLSHYFTLTRCQNTLTPISGQGGLASCWSWEILSLWLGQASCVWNSMHLPGCLQALLNMAQILASIFPSELSSVLLTDGVCMTCCHDKINPIPCKTNLPDFIFPDGGKK